MRTPPFAPLVLVLLLGAPAPTALAQLDLSPAERQAAAEAAYDRGTRAYRGGNYAQAAQWYETANELAPAAAAALQAVRAYQRAGNFLRAATLVAFVESEYGEEHTERFRRPLERARSEGFELRVLCAECEELEVDGEREIFRTLYLVPDVQHTVLATFETGRVEERTSGGAGESQEMPLNAPEPEPDPEPLADPVLEDPIRNPQPRPRIEPEPSGISPAFFLTGLALTAATGGVAIWSWLDTLDAASDYESAPTQEKLDAGRDLELRSTILLVSTCVLGAVSLILLPFTNWSGGSDDTESASASLDFFGVAPLPEGGVSASAGGRF
jgi:hypothetical protein